MSACEGGSNGPLLWTWRVPAEQLERLRWTTGVRVAGGHPGLYRVGKWKSDLRNPPRSPSAPHAAATEVGKLEISSCILSHYSYLVYLCSMTLTVCCRVISRAPGLKLVVETLITSLRPIGNIVLICCAFFIVFGILGVQVNICAIYFPIILC